MKNLRNFWQKIADFWVGHQPKIVLMLMVIGALDFLRKLPYFNILLTFYVYGVFFWLILLLLFRLKSRSTMVVAAFLLFLTGFAVIIQKLEFAQETAMFSYYLIVIAFIQAGLENHNEKRKIV